MVSIACVSASIEQGLLWGTYLRNDTEFWSEVMQTHGASVSTINMDFPHGALDDTVQG